MRNKNIFILLFLSFAISVNSIPPWGFFAHKRVNKYAVFTLPEELIGFYKKNINYVEEHAVDADKRRYALKEEAPRHYIDIDHYGEHPFDSMPRKWEDAVEKYTEDTLQEYGIVPWYIHTVYNRLVYAFIDKDADKILKYSADLGHYVADAHVPLHTTENYDGQLTGHKDRQYSYEKRGTKTINVRSEEFSLAYHEMLSGMVERRMRKTIISIGSLWYSAWVDAGQPVLDGMQNSSTPFTEEIKIDHKITKEDARGHQH